MKGFKRFFSVIFALILCFSCSVSAFAATEEISATNSISLDSEEIMPCGSLSGYAQFSFKYGTSTTIGSFPIQVNGSWSPWAGWTVKTEFSGAANITVSLTRPDGTKIGDTFILSGNQEVANKTLLNVPAGQYTVHYTIDSASSGSITVWIY